MTPRFSLVFSLRESATVEIENQSCFKVPMQYDNVRKVADAFTDTELLSKQGCDGGLISKLVIMQLYHKQIKEGKKYC
jgi:hypothetical protein